MTSFSAVELIIQKREHGELSTEQINWLIDSYTKGSVADEQMSAMAMAILLNGMNRREIGDLTSAMIASGEKSGRLSEVLEHAATAAEDDNEEDELENVPKHKKTKNGYLKDGFVVDSSDADESESASSSETEDDDLTEATEEDEKDTDVILEDIGSELSEESYDYDDDNVAK